MTRIAADFFGSDVIIMTIKGLKKWVVFQYCSGGRRRSPTRSKGWSPPPPPRPRGHDKWITTFLCVSRGRENDVVFFQLKTILRKDTKDLSTESIDLTALRPMVIVA